MHKNRGSRYGGKSHVAADRSLVCAITFVKIPQIIMYRGEQV
jgi:hypothetical protein